MQKRTSFQIVRSVLLALVLREMRTRLSIKRFGAFWILFEPFAHVSILLLISVYIRGKHIPGIEAAVFLASGIIPFLLFRNIYFKGMEAIASNRALFSYKQIKPLDTILSRAVVEVIISACLYVLMMFFLGFFWNYDVGIVAPLGWGGTMVVGILLSFGIGLNLCVLAELFPDIKYFIRLMFFPMYLLSGVIFPIWILPPEILGWLLWNPYLHIIDILRQHVFENYPFVPGVEITYPLKIALVLLFSGLMLLRLKRDRLVAI